MDSYQPFWGAVDGFGAEEGVSDGFNGALPNAHSLQTMSGMSHAPPGALYDSGMGLRTVQALPNPYANRVPPECDPLLLQGDPNMNTVVQPGSLNDFDLQQFVENSSAQATDPTGRPHDLFGSFTTKTSSASSRLSAASTATTTTTTTTTPNTTTTIAFAPEDGPSEPKRKCRKIENKRHVRAEDSEEDDNSKDLAEEKGRREKESKAPGKAKENASRPDKFLERNRIAASKCRQKKKQWMSGLEETKNELETRNSHLHMEARSLTEQVSQMKIELMRHAQCNDSMIDSWITTEARNFVLKTSEQGRQNQAAACGSSHLQHERRSASLSTSTATRATSADQPDQVLGHDQVSDNISEDDRGGRSVPGGSAS